MGTGSLMKKRVHDEEGQCEGVRCGAGCVAVAELEKLLRVVERFKCRCFVPGSIKHYELVKED